MIWFTSDSHLFHSKIIQYEPITRPFSSVEEMNETIISNWNSVVKPDDEIYVLGDFIMGDVKNIEPTIKRLNGKITLVRGNHDTKSKLIEYQRLGIEVKDIAYIPYQGRFFICCHFPITNEEFIRMIVEDNSEVVFLYGHTHSKSPKGYTNGTYHIGADTNNLTPISIEQIWEEAWPEEIMTEDIKAYKIAHALNPNLEDQQIKYQVYEALIYPMSDAELRRGARAQAGLYEDWSGADINTLKQTYGQVIASARPVEISVDSINAAIMKALEEAEPQVDIYKELVQYINKNNKN